jgi:hypothetical protein
MDTAKAKRLQPGRFAASRGGESTTTRVARKIVRRSRTSAKTRK